MMPLRVFKLMCHLTVERFRILRERCALQTWRIGYPTRIWITGEPIFRSTRFQRLRTRGSLQFRDYRIHGLWLCVETPTAGGRVFEKGDEYLLKFAHDIQIPVVLVFTQYDRLVRSKKAELQEEHENLDEIFLRDQSEKDARDAFNKCLQSLQRTLDRMDVPMPHCARVSGMFRGHDTPWY
ncbi:hypothetical protein EDB92DRAFT_1545551 [Lactarius akahatsu]|uniref:Uncharacterized protein n=1 Tax=Lactarius akahatsu TaxID=416441 RepID=A0AAD4Q9Z8_9AGAM|nr:hypothetical protein EDB92DRAFT_1545551 [Lactarius akahatsu]